MPRMNPISPGLPPIPDACPLCQDPLRVIGGRFVPEVQDTEVQGKQTVAHTRCVQDPHHARMTRAFRLVRPEGDWRGPINRLVTTKALQAADVSLGDVDDAVTYFTATCPEVTGGYGGWRVTAPGYRMGPAGP